MDAMSYIELFTAKLFSLLCHQHEALCFSVDTKNIPMCYRCVGLHFGFSFAYILARIYRKQHGLYYNKSTLILFLILISNTGFHWLLTYSDLLESINDLKLFTGIISGTTFGLFFQFYHRGKFLSEKSDQTLHLTKLLIPFVFLSASIQFKLLSLFSYTTFHILLPISVIFNLIYIIKNLIINLLTKLLIIEL